MSKEIENEKTVIKRAITLKELKSITKETFIDLPPFEEDGKLITVQVRRINISKELLNKNSITSQMLKPEILNKFKNKNQEEIEKDIINDDSSVDIIQTLMPNIDKMCQYILINPTYEQFEEISPLTIEQKTFIFSWAVSGIQGLKKNN